MSSPLVSRMQGFADSIFSEMTQRALQYDAVNLGQGFPDQDTPAALKQIAQDQIASGANQYAPGIGKPVLRQAIAEHQRRFYGLTVDPDTEVLVTVGATEALTATVLALVEPGDEVITFEPFFDIYASAIAVAGGVQRTVPMLFPDFAMDFDGLKEQINDRTRAIMLNNPHNPTGRVFSEEELSQLAAIAIQHDLIVISDEVYEHLVFDGLTHTPIAALPGMAQRTLTVSSGGKTFSATGWKVGWVHGNAELISAVKAVKQAMTFAASGPFQDAIAEGLGFSDKFFAAGAEDLQSRRDLLLAGLTEIGIPFAQPAGTYFVVADVSGLGGADALAFCRRAPKEYGVVAVPVSAFCATTDHSASLVRLAYCKRPETISAGIDKLAALAPDPAKMP
ncbi:aminotransferase class I/II-fold pyridoxal phosphate-dependent enzyme [Ornithinimicrobium sp. Arc0846-15]|nr:aminotransferase class I/II-fold pyridoxal phosphate-dependent enzyme [Ornithinimicrobium laminariae]